MSSIASFIDMPEAALGGLRDAAIPKRRLFRGPADTYQDYLRSNGRDVLHYNWSGYVLATVLAYLQEKYQIDIGSSDSDDLARFLTQARGATHCVLTRTHRAAFLNRIAPEKFSEGELQAYFNEFNATDQPEMGKAMKEGIAALHASLNQLVKGRVVLVIIG